MIDTAALFARILLKVGLANLNTNIVSASFNALNVQLSVIVGEFNDLCIDASKARSYPQQINLNLGNFTVDANSQYSIYNTVDNINTNGIVDIINWQPLIGSNSYLGGAQYDVTYRNVESFYAAAKLQVQGGVYPAISAFDEGNRTFLLSPPLNTSILSGMVVRAIYGMPLVTMLYTPPLGVQPAKKLLRNGLGSLVPSAFTFTPEYLNLPYEAVFIDYLINQTAINSATALSINIDPAVNQQSAKYSNALRRLKAKQQHERYLQCRQQANTLSANTGSVNADIIEALMVKRTGIGIYNL